MLTADAALFMTTSLKTAARYHASAPANWHRILTRFSYWLALLCPATGRS